MTGFNLPPGCEEWHIPGNRPEDIKQDKLAEEFSEALDKLVGDFKERGLSIHVIREILAE